MQKAKVLVNILFAMGDKTVQEQQQLSPYSYQIYPKQRKVNNVVVADHTGTVMGKAETPVRLTQGRDRHYLYFMNEKRVEWVLISKEAFTAIRSGAKFSVEAAEAEIIKVGDVVTAGEPAEAAAEAAEAGAAPDQGAQEPEMATTADEAPIATTKGGKNKRK